MISEAVPFAAVPHVPFSRSPLHVGGTTGAPVDPRSQMGMVFPTAPFALIFNLTEANLLLLSLSLPLSLAFMLPVAMVALSRGYIRVRVSRRKCFVRVPLA